MAPALGFATGRREGFPEAFARLQLEAAELPIAARAVDVSALDQRRGHDAVQSIRVLLTDLLALPDRLRLVRADAQEQRAVVERSEEQQITDLERAGDAHAVSHRRRECVGPDDLARLRLQRVHRLGMPEDELTFARKFINHRRRVARLLRTERAPEFLARVLVVGDGDAALAARETDDFLSIHERMTGEAPHRRLEAEFLFEIMRPQRGALHGVEADQVSFGPERIDFSLRHRGRDARSRRVAHRVGALVFVLPQDFSIGLIETQHALAPGNRAAVEGALGILRVLRQLPVHHIHAALRHRWPRVPAADGRAPAIGETIRRQFLHNARLAPDPVALGAEPLRPVLGAERERRERDEAERQRRGAEASAPVGP